MKHNFEEWCNQCNIPYEECGCGEQLPEEEEIKEEKSKPFLERISNIFKDLTKEPDINEQIERSELLERLEKSKAQRRKFKQQHKPKDKSKGGDNILDRLGDMI